MMLKKWCTFTTLAWTSWTRILAQTPKIILSPCCSWHSIALWWVICFSIGLCILRVVVELKKCELAYLLAHWRYEYWRYENRIDPLSLRDPATDMTALLLKYQQEDYIVKCSIVANMCGIVFIALYSLVCLPLLRKCSDFCQSGEFVEEETRILYHFHFLSWPDKSVPKNPGPLLEFIREIKDLRSEMADHCPCVVHCRWA